ncbi:hypothetical protein GXM21_04905 [Megamonas funiformis]|uniref:DUF2577 domain-containing protein n=1 Tax=Megamonas funiformis YIT 11815 TaxID=742816 RepID=A0ABP2NKP1_9FIRM|nr:hypothetical protein [Megamonas funiformis]EHR37695.1 hypothetical protein HMPREF9454_00939 [Megamonas funiformis YIT 11815]QIB59749.1 hypothetical protein GXM21_04905 [Megamonas funiformis]
MKNPFKELAALIDEQAKKRVNDGFTGQWITSQIGTVTAKGVMIDGFPYELTNVYVNRACTLNEPYMTNTKNVAGGSGDAQYESHSHPVITPTPILPLHIGDRVKVTPINGGQYWCIDCVIVPFTGGA